MSDPEDLSDEGEIDFRDLARGKKYHVRLLPIIWVWVRFEARRAGVLPAQWIRQAVAQYDAELGGDERYKGKVLHVRVGRDEWERVQELAREADKSPSDIVRRAINQRLTVATGMAESTARTTAKQPEKK